MYRQKISVRSVDVYLKFIYIVIYISLKMTLLIRFTALFGSSGNIFNIGCCM